MHLDVMNLDNVAMAERRFHSANARSARVEDPWTLPVDGRPSRLGRAGQIKPVFRRPR
jgi:hypothetical protein